MGYLTNFIVYTLAMLGIIILAIVVFKYSAGFKVKNNSGRSTLKVLETLSLSTRKTLYVVEAEGEKFLIAGDIDNTTLISKLGAPVKTEPERYIKESIANKNNMEISYAQKSSYESVMKSLAEKMRNY